MADNLFSRLNRKFRSLRSLDKTKKQKSVNSATIELSPDILIDTFRFLPRKTLIQRIQPVSSYLFRLCNDLSTLPNCHLIPLIITCRVGRRTVKKRLENNLAVKDMGNQVFKTTVLKSPISHAYPTKEWWLQLDPLQPAVNERTFLEMPVPEGQAIRFGRVVLRCQLSVFLMEHMKSKMKHMLSGTSLEVWDNENLSRTLEAHFRTVFDECAIGELSMLCINYSPDILTLPTVLACDRLELGGDPEEPKSSRYYYFRPKLPDVTSWILHWLHYKTGNGNAERHLLIEQKYRKWNYEQFIEDVQETFLNAAQRCNFTVTIYGPQLQIYGPHTFIFFDSFNETTQERLSLFQLDVNIFRLWRRRSSEEEMKTLLPSAAGKLAKNRSNQCLNYNENFYRYTEILSYLDQFMTIEDLARKLYVNVARDYQGEIEG
ncbi:hypothetical protein DdX_13249 [Ditylenchus destructor]|uniref:Uncharacterized protein n=1 Tax=Ditylenchus destructor TaxID=166010 RepID=A0AAD4R2Y2_9BILA|nr:hypothetical protein DdX_13249 [Ditylenchus destructor]